MKHLLLAAAALSVLCAQQKPEPKCSIEGTVFNALTGEPLSKGRVIAFPADGADPAARPAATITDASGQFAFHNLQPGRYSVRVSRPGYVAAPRKSAQVLLTLNTGESAKGVVLKLSPNAVISGRVLDRDGDPVVMASVTVLARILGNGTRSFQPVASSTTNDRGEYRVFNLLPGEYIVMAETRSEMAVQDLIQGDSAAQYSLTYYPNASSPAGAIRIKAAAGTEVSAIDVKLLKMHTSRVRGVVSGIAKGRLGSIMVRPAGEGSGESIRQEMVTTSDDGFFTIPNVKPGSYHIFAEATGEGDQKATGNTLIEVGDNDINDVRIALTPSVTITGRFTIEGKAEMPGAKSDSYYVSLAPTGGAALAFGAAGATADAEGHFELKDVGPHKYNVLISAPGGAMYAKSMLFGSTELQNGVLDFSGGTATGELTIVLSSNCAQVEGTVFTSDKKPEPSASVLAIPIDRDPHIYRQWVLADQSGRFIIRSLAPGKYRLLAFESGNTYPDEDSLTALEDRTETVDLKESSRETKDLTLIRID